MNDQMHTYDFLAEAARDAVVVPRDEQLATVAFLARRQREMETTVANLENALKNAKADLRNVAEHELPEAMQALGISEFKLTDGSKVKVAPFFGLSIPEGREEEAYQWLEEHEHGDIVKRSYTITVRLSRSDKLLPFMKMAEELNLDTTDKKGIHHMTGGAWVREQVKEGADIPRDLLGVFTGFRAKVEVPK